MRHIDKLRYMGTCYEISYYYLVFLNSFGYVLPGGQTQGTSWMLAREVGLTTIPHKDFSALFATQRFTFLLLVLFHPSEDTC